MLFQLVAINTNSFAVARPKPSILLRSISAFAQHLA